MRVAVVENLRNTRLGIVGRALDEAGAEVDWFRPWQDGGLPSVTDRHDALIVLGGTQSALDDADYPYLPALVRTMRRFGDAEKAVLGICLGAQLLARAYGAENLLGTAREFAWTPLEVTPEGAADPLFADLDRRFESFQWHVDTFTLPDSAVPLVTGAAVANQCFRIGRTAYGMQFHFEADSEVVEAWLTEFRDVVEMRRPGWLERYPELAAQHAAGTERAGLALARAFVRSIHRDDRTGSNRLTPAIPAT
ncbi:MAG: GMP synthase [Alphaproteobacteria bacterium 65-37]|uniref:type 1 glutamine amidotransferase n=1 Tax=Reyranella sp. TaxID=1929291 RepID=UPI000968B5DE|nr:type 1 glutamine amidotransferase [Reyranella sp.]MBN9541646.1 type 1 glutamine amidotransferase [Alphaproteobacteria bacterium]OJU44948.1 MAG: GMP synthase [Alphaproteobacteria bacterium 65-37]